MKTVEEVRKIVAAVRAREEDEPTEDELPCVDCPAEGFCSESDYYEECVEVLEAWLKQQDAAK